MRPDYPTTAWGLIDRAKGGDQGALGALLERYRTPLVQYLQSFKFVGADPEDLVQETFRRFVEGHKIRGVDRSKGRFRHLLRAMVENVLREHLRSGKAVKRGGGRRVASLDAPIADDSSSLLEVLRSPDSQATFDQHWVQNLLQRAMERLRKEQESGRHQHYEMLRMQVEEKKAVFEIAGLLGRSQGATKVALHEARQKLRGFMEEEVRLYSRNERDYETEIRLLKRYLPGFLTSD